MGTFVCSQGTIYRTVGRLTTSQNDIAGKENVIRVVEYVPVEESKIEARAVLEASLSPFNELVQGCQISTISTSDIDEIAFVFHEKNFVEYHVAPGFRLAFFVRYTEDDQYIDADTFYCFPDLSPKYPLHERSFALEVFQELSRIADASATILTRAAESQGRSGSAQVFVSPRTVQFLQRGLGLEPYEYDIHTSHKRTLSGCKTFFFKRKRHCKYFRMETETQLENLMKLIGPTIVIGNRIKRMRPGTSFQPLAENDLVNAVVTDPSATPSVLFKRRTTRRGVDICTDGEVLKLYIRYRSSTINPRY